MKMNDKQIAILYKSVALPENVYFLYATKAEIGNVSSAFTTEEKLVAQDGKTYYPIINQEAFQQEGVLLYDDFDDFQDEIEEYLQATKQESTLTDFDLEEIKDSYLEAFQKDVLFVWFQNGNVNAYHIDLNSISEQLQNLDSDMPYMFGDDLLSLLLSSESLEEVKSLLVEIFGTPSPSKQTETTQGINNIQISKPPQKIDVQELEDYVNERIIGHKEQIADIVTILVSNQQADNYREMERILVAGPTGIGKTETFEAIADYLKVPFVNYAVTTLSDAGLVGKDVDDILKFVYFKADGDLEKAKRAIVVLDEIDKIAIRGNDVSQISVQQNLLKLLEGHTFDISLDCYDDITPIDTRFMSFIGCGAFPSLFEEHKQIGIHTNADDMHENKKKNPTLQDFFRFGMIPELMGRFEQIEFYKSLTEQERYQVLTTSKISPYLIKQQQFKKIFNLDLQADPSYFTAILEETKDSSIGLRSLKNTVNRSLLKLQNQLLKNPCKYKEAWISQETVKDAKQYILKS